MVEINRKFLIFIAIVCVVGALALAGCTEEQKNNADQNSPDQQTLVVGGYRDFKDCGQMKSNVFDTFLDIGETGRPKAGTLVESWEVSDNKKEYTFHLNQDVEFHDGTEWNSTTAKWFFEWCKEGPRSTRTVFQKIDEVEISSEYTIKTNLSEQYGAFLKDLTSPWRAEVIPPTSVKPEWSKQGEIVDFIGTGPFKVKEYVKGQKAVIVSKGGGKVEEIVFKTIEDPQSRVSALRAGDVDIIGATEHHASIPYESVPTLKEDSNIIVERKSYGRVQTLEFNCLDGPTTDIKVRKAVNYALNREDMVEKLLAAVAPPMSTILTPRYPFAKSLEGEGYPYDPAKSKELLSEAGWEDTDDDGIREKNGEELVLDYVVPKGEANANSIAVFVQSELEEVGIKVNVQIMERGAAGKAEDKGNFDLYLHHMYGIPGLPEGPLTGIYWSENPDPGDKWKYHSEELDNLIETALSTGKDEDYAKAYRLLQEQHACVPLYDIEKVVAHKKDVKGFEFGPSIYRTNFATVYLEK